MTAQHILRNQSAMRGIRSDTIWIPFSHDDILTVNAARILMDGRTAMARFLKRHFATEAQWIHEKRSGAKPSV